MRRVISVLVLAVVAAGIWGCGGFSFEVKIPKNIIAEQVVQKFPMERHKGLLSITISDPQLDFSVGGNRIGVKANTIVSVLGLLPVEGETLATGELEYSPQDGSFKFVKVEVEKFQMKDLSEDKVDEVTDMVGSIVASVLGGLEIYRLDPSKTEEKLASLVLKDVRIENDGVVAVLGLGK